jgi:hypothetical protein
LPYSFIYRALIGKGRSVKMTISKSETTVMMGEKYVGKPVRNQSISDTYGMGKPTRTNPVGGFMAMHCYSGSPDQKQSPTTNGVTGFKKRGY